MNQAVIDNRYEVLKRRERCFADPIKKRATGVTRTNNDYTTRSQIHSGNYTT